MLRRLLTYLHEMFPVSAFAGTILMAFAVELVIGKLSGFLPYFHPEFLLTGVAVSAVSLLIRIMDEFKDYQDDLKNFPDRPLPSGRVKPRDLKLLAWVCVAVVLAVSVALDVRTLFPWSLCVLGFTFLMLKWFFIEERMRRSLPLAFVSHHPIVFLNFIYIMIAAYGVYPYIRAGVGVYILPLCFIFTNWEIARKIRAPAQETAYTTYSKIWGPRAATVVTLCLQGIFFATFVVILQKLEAALWFRLLFGLCAGLSLIPFLSFLVTLRQPRPLKDFAEAQILLVMVFLLASVFV